MLKNSGKPDNSKDAFGKFEILIHSTHNLLWKIIQCFYKTSNFTQIKYNFSLTNLKQLIKWISNYNLYKFF